MKTTLLLASVLSVLFPSTEARTLTNNTQSTETKTDTETEPKPKHEDPRQPPFENDTLKNITNKERKERLDPESPSERSKRLAKEAEDFKKLSQP
jgi:hypothetical protein